MLCHGSDGDHEVVGGPHHDGGEVDVHRLIATNGPTEGNSALDLVALGYGGFVLNRLSLFRLWW
jgi:hypothetical protein